MTDCKESEVISYPARIVLLALFSILMMITMGDREWRIDCGIRNGLAMQTDLLTFSAGVTVDPQIVLLLAFPHFTGLCCFHEFLFYSFDSFNCCQASAIIYIVFH